MPLIKIIVVLGAVMTGAAYIVLAERRICAFIQGRIGPNRVGPVGLLQPLADAIKLLLKEDLLPAHSRKILYTLAPAILVITSIIALAVVPFGKPAANGNPIQIADQVDVGLLFLLAVGSLGVYSLILAGWSSGSKYSLLGALRSSAQVISYEIAWGLSIVSVLMVAGSLKLDGIVDAQINSRALGFIPGWFALLQPVACLVFFVSALAETNRLPFDLPEAEQELSAGYHTEYSGMKFGMFFVAEYANMIVSSAIFTCLFLGGWHLPFFPPGYFGGGYGEGLINIIVFSLKCFAFLFVFIWIRWTLPRFRYDQLMRLGWKFFIPIALINVFATGIIMALAGME